MEMVQIAWIVAGVAIVSSLILWITMRWWMNCRDNLTRLMNRTAANECMENWLNDARKLPLTFLLLDMDDFKLYNRLYGSDEADRALVYMADMTKRLVGKKGKVARFSGKEFAILLPNTRAEQGRELAEAIQEQIHRKNNRNSRHWEALTASIGITTAYQSGMTSQEMINNAGLAVHHVKHTGKSGIRVFDPKQDTKIHSMESNSLRKEIYREYEASILALMAAIDAKDHYTFSHSHNVAYYSVCLARALKMDEDSVEAVRQAGLLHDIGKIGVPEEVLNKTGKLTPEEYELMKSHVDAAVGIIRHLPALDYIIPAVVGHHERYDGKGYMEGKKGEEIPLSARILCVADSFDAMTSKRCYKEAMSVERSVSILKEEAGKQFDPYLVQLFVRGIEDGSIRVMSECHPGF